MAKKVRSPVEKALPRVERLLARAEGMCREVAGVFSGRAVRRAERQAFLAAKLIRQAIRLVTGPFFERLGFPGRIAEVLPALDFPDRKDGPAFVKLGRALLYARNGFDWAIEIPDRKRCEETLVLMPRQALREVTRLARLDSGSREIRAFRAGLRRLHERYWAEFEERDARENARRHGRKRSS